MSKAGRNIKIMIDILSGEPIVDVAQKYEISSTVARKIFLRECQKANPTEYKMKINTGCKTPSLKHLVKNRHNFLQPIKLPDLPNIKKKNGTRKSIYAPDFGKYIKIIGGREFKKYHDCQECFFYDDKGCGDKCKYYNRSVFPGCFFSKGCRPRFCKVEKITVHERGE